MPEFLEDDVRWMREALALAREARGRGEVPVGAVIVDQHGRVLGKGFNQTEALRDPTAHAEILAIGAAANALDSPRLTGTTMYVTLEPCAMCAGALVQARVERLVFGAIDPKAGACGSLFDIVDDRRLNHRLRVSPGCLADESGFLLRSFFDSLRRDEASGD
jgi:tRNA(adenine34) deaminase